ncbi:hypothetical protein SAMN05421636_102356 [Pricia antarctica]|uniref:Uncharacterized protein n=1 Tax=Pricia antarctica TaxID=641691 RepID=A0A1G6YT07_9FLAO|nr:hypothetical protein [Pricia antarctica]SDD93183.1 hypothetical protein SAMN05421636_102356 [Pricia antarctica]
MGFQITYNKLFEVAFWHHAQLRTSSYDPALFGYDTVGYDPLTSPFIIPLSTVVPDEVGRRLLNFDLRNLLHIRPNPETAELLKQLGLVFKTTTLGFWVVYNELRDLPADDALRFTFDVALVAPEFIDQVEVKPDWPRGKVFHLSNAQQPPENRYLLSDNAAVGEVLHSNHFFERRGRIVRVPQLAPGSATTLEVFDALAAAAAPPIFTVDFPAVNQQTEYELDLRPLREGRYRINGPNINEITLYLGLENRPGILGVIDLFPNAWEGTIYDIRLAEATV